MTQFRNPAPDPRPIPAPVFTPHPSPPTASPAPVLEADEEEVSGQHLESSGTKLASVSEPRERQAVDVRPMYFVLGAGIVGTVVGMIVTYAFF